MDKNFEQKIIELRALFPREITASVQRSEDGGFVAEVLTYPGMFTEGETFSELLEMINDAVYTYFEVPENLLSFMPTYLPSVKEAGELVGFPVRTGGEKINLKLPEYEAVDR